MKNMSHVIFNILIMSFVLATQVVWAEVTATLARDEISENETFQLIVSIDETSLFNNQQPSTNVLDKDFNLLGQSKRSQSSWINGKKTQKTSWVLTLKAKQSGLFTIPPISIGKQSSQALSIKVSPIKTFKSDNTLPSKQAIFIEASLEPNEAYVQQQMILSIKFNDSLRLSNIGLSPLNIAKVNMVELSNTSYQRLIDNKTYTTYQLRYALFPQTSGTLKVPNIVVSADKLMSSSGRRSYEPVRIQSQTIEAIIKAIPSNYGYKHWLPAQSISLEETYSKGLDQLEVGDAITRTVTLNASGVSAEQLPEISIANTAGIKIYPENAQRNTVKNSNKTVQSNLIQSFSIVLTESGNITLPEIQQAWFNTATEQIEITTLAAKEINVKANPTLITKNQTAQNNEAIGNVVKQPQPINYDLKPAIPANKTIQSWSDLPNSFKIVIYCATAVITILFISVLVLCWRIQKIKQQLQEKGNDSQELNAVKIRDLLAEIGQAIDNKRYPELRQCFIVLAQQRLTQSNIIALADIMPFINEVSSQILHKLDAHLYRGQVAPEKSELIILRDAINMAKSNKKPVSAFSDLYPQ